MPGKASEREKISAIVAGVNRVAQDGSLDQTDFAIGPEVASNRGNKLKRKAVFAHEDSLGGHAPYKKRINHAGFDRHILHRNPLRYDEDGALLDSDEEDAEADADAADRDPYHGVDVQGLLAPLVSVSDLWQHPGMSHTFTSEALSEMVTKARETLRTERRTLSSVKELATRFRGDHTRTLSSMLWTDSDINLYSAENILKGLPEIDELLGMESRTPEPAIAVNIVAAEDAATNGAREEGTQAEDVNMAEGDAELPVTVNGVAEAVSSTIESGEAGDNAGSHTNGKRHAQVPRKVGDNDASPQQADEFENGHAREPETNGTPGSDEQNGDGEAPDGVPARRMVTRGAAAAANGTTGQEHDLEKQRSSSPTSSQPGIHPTFLPPQSSAPDRDLGLPPWEAEETRKLANIYIQKQEEVVRGVERMYELFLKAERLRKTVYWWSRAEAHAGEMSDGEEWVDQKEWGLDAPLRKGAAEGEEEGREEERKGKGRRTRAVAGS